jgi:Putative Ig domain
MNTTPPNLTKRASSGAALIIVLAFVVLLTVLVVAYFSRTTTDRQLAQSSFNDTSGDLLARSALDIVVSDLKQEIATNTPVSATNIQPQRAGDDVSIPNLIRRSFSGDTNLTIRSRASTVNSAPVDPANPKRGEITSARWNSHYLIPTGSNFTAPDWVLVTPQGPNSGPAPGAVIGRYAYAVYDEGGLIDINLGGFPTYASLTLPTRRSTHRLKYPSEESEIILCGQVPSLNPNQSGSGTVGTSVSFSPKWKQSPSSYGYTGSLPAGLSLSPTIGVISGTPSRSGTYNLNLTATNGSGTGSGTFPVTITGAAEAASTPWPVNLARKGTVAFADLTALPSNPAVTTLQIKKLIGWRNYATTQQSGASFDSPSFPPDLTHEEYYAKYFLGPGGSFTTPFTTVSASVGPDGRTDQAVMSRQELIKLQRTIGFNQSLLQYLGTFSREQNRPAPDWPQLNNKLPARFDINNLSLVVPDPAGLKFHGNGHHYGQLKKQPIGLFFGLEWVDGMTFESDGITPIPRTDPRYYGHWVYIGKGDVNQTNPNAQGHIKALAGGNPDFFQILDYAMTRSNADTDDIDPNHLRNAFNVGAALIDQYDTDDLDDGVTGNTITIINYNNNTNNYAYGMESMSYDDPAVNQSRPPSAPNPPAGYVLLNRRFENVGEFGYAYNPGSTTLSKTLDFFSSASTNAPILDFFTYNTASRRAGIVNLNTRNGPVLASIIQGALLNDPGAQNTPTALVSQQDALTAGQNIVVATTAAGGAAVNRGAIARLAVAAVQGTAMAASDETRNTIARTLAEIGQTRTWSLMIDVIAQTGKYAPGTTDFTDPTKFIVQGEKRYWLHIALDRDDGTVLGQQLEEVTE